MVENMDNEPGGFGMMRFMGTIMNRLRLASGMTFDGIRDLYKALGYKRDLQYRDYELRYRRGDVSTRFVEIHPKATWASGCEILENQDPKKITEFEQAFIDLDNKVHFWNAFLRADILAGLEEYAVLVIGAPGDPAKPIPDGSGSIDGIGYLMPYRKSNALIHSVVSDIRNPRFGQAELYQISYKPEGVISADTQSVNRLVHWTRVVHVADNLLESNISGVPRLENIWNRLDDLDKIVGGGAEAFWKTVYQGMQLDVDKEMDLDEDAKRELSAQIDEFEANMRRVFRTRGVKANPLGVNAVDFYSQMSAVIDIMCAAKGIPKRIFMGSERGELASAQDKATWDDEIDDRRSQFAWPSVVKPFVDRLIEHNYVPKPSNGYFVMWPERTKMTPTDKAVVAQRLSSLNKSMGAVVTVPSDIRERVLGWDPLTPAQESEVPDPAELMGREVGPPPEKQPNKSKQSAGDTTEVRSK
jgi:hypothetical protein